MVSKKHKNRKPYNWLAYDLVDKCLSEHAFLFKGVLYDLGCGEKPYKTLFEQYCENYLGVDWSNSLHEISADVLANLNEILPIDSSSADTVVSISVLEHLSEPQNMLNEAYRMLRPGGNIVLQVPFQWRVHEEPYDFFRYTSHGLKYMFEKAGFADIKIIPLSGFWSMWFLKLNYQTARLVRGPGVVRLLVMGLLMPIWWFNQMLAPVIDKSWPSTEETIGYFVAATKPLES